MPKDIGVETPKNKHLTDKLHRKIHARMALGTSLAHFRLQAGNTREAQK